LSILKNTFKKNLITLSISSVLLLTANVGHASCFYNHGGFGVSFSSTWWSTGGYSSENLHPGQAQCWYAHGWDKGYINYKNQLGDFLGGVLFTGISIPGHGWVVVDGTASFSVGALCDVVGWSNMVAYNNNGGLVDSGKVTNIKTCMTPFT